MSLDASTLLTDELKAWVGRTFGPFAMPEEISASDVRRYADATGDRNPLWLDEAYARSYGYEGRIVPPTLVVDLSWRMREEEADATRAWHFALPLPPNYSDARNAGREIEWLRPVYVGDRLSIEHRIVDIQVRQGRAGLGVYVTRRSEYMNQKGEVVARVTHTLVRLPRADRSEANASASAGA